MDQANIEYLYFRECGGEPNYFMNIRDLIFTLFYRFWLVWLIIYSLSSGFFLLAIESTWNGGIVITISKLWLPLAILVFGYTFFFRDKFYDLNTIKNDQVTNYSWVDHNAWDHWLIAIAFYALMLFFSWGHGMAINAFTSSGEIVVIEGKVREKFISSGKSEAYLIRIIDKQTYDEEILRVSPYIYSSLSVGDTYKEQFYKGGFGIPYRWRK